MATLEEKQAELDAVQSAFDEYIVSSRELEEELDAELTKCQKDLSQAEHRNSALVSQLANLTPQLTSLETKLSTLTSQLQQESQRRIAAELLAEEAQNKLRESEGSLAAVRSSEVRKLKDELEEVYERLAFVEGEAEDYRNELDIERERHREEMDETRQDCEVLRGKLREKEELLRNFQVRDGGGEENGEHESLEVNGVANVESSESLFEGGEADEQISSTQPSKSDEQQDGNAEREEYIKTLEDELELVTEQLIEAETKLSQTQAQLEETLAQVAENSAKSAQSGADAEETKATIKQQTDKIAELESAVQLLQEENTLLNEESKRLKEELELATEELALSREELEASEEDNKAQAAEFEAERKQHKEKMVELQTKLDKFSSEERSREIELKSWEDSLVKSEKETQSLQEEVERLEIALNNSKKDYEGLQEEMEELKSAFDETAKHDRMESEGQQEVMEELLATRSREVDELKGEVKNLIDTNTSLTKMLKDTEDDLRKHQTEIERHQKSMASAASKATTSTQELQDAQDEIYSLEGLLEESRKELAGQRDEVVKVRNSLKEQLSAVQTRLDVAEKELASTRSKLVAAESRPQKADSERSPGAFEKMRPKLMSKVSFTDVPLWRESEHDEEDYSSQSEFFQSHALSRRLFSHKSRSRPRSCSPTTIQRLEGDAERRAAANSSLQSKCLRLEDQNRMNVSMKNLLEDENKLLQKQLQNSNIGKPQSLNEEEKDSGPDLTTLDDADIEVVLESDDREKIAEEFRLMAKKISSQKSHNAELLTRILKLQGNIQVCCRIRPMAFEESQKGLREVAQSLSETELGCFDERTKTWKSYAFDKVWGPTTKQRDVFQDVEPMALSVIDGYNACIFAYGQTGSGKTYTMEGDKSKHQYGISQRTIQKIFSMLQDRVQQNQKNNNVDGEDPSYSAPFEYSIEVGMLEIYNEEVYDLLSPSFSTNSHGSPQRNSLEVRHGPENTVEVPNLHKEKVNSVAEVLDALDRGNSNRATASTNLNERSSRSHMILHVEVTSGIGEAKSKGSLYLVDLAGSERVRKSAVAGKALKEAQHINKSLSALGNVMEALDRKSSHVPYRDSKLTHLLQNSLGGNSRTMMVVTVCPHNDSYDETTFALKFATRVRRINLGSAHKNITAKNLEETVKNLTSQLNIAAKAKERLESQMLSFKKEKERVEEKLSKVSTSRSESKDEMRTLSVLRQSNHDITARWQREKSIREEKTLELEKTQEELRRSQRDLTNVKREHDYLKKQNDDKENAIFELKKDLRSMKEQLNEEKIRLRRSQVIQSRIPAPTSTSRRPLSSQSSTASSKSASAHKSRPPAVKKRDAPLSSGLRNADKAIPNTSGLRGGSDPRKHDPTVIRERVLKMLQEHDPTKVDKIDVVMSKFQGREGELLDKMIARYENDSKSVASISEVSTGMTDDRPKSRQDLALERHMARMKRKKALAAGHDPN